MVMASLLDARGILCHIGGYNHASVSFYQLALGGFRLAVPTFQHREASEIIAETPGFGRDQFSYGLQKAVARFLLLWFGLVFLMGIAKVAGNPENWVADLLVVPIFSLVIPVNPQGHGTYFLSVEEPV